MNFFKNKSILITGGTGSFGSKFLNYLLKLKSNKPKKVIVFSRDELKQFELMKTFDYIYKPYLNKNELIRKFIQLGCFKEGNFLLKSGKQSNYYVDLRCLVSHPSILKQICELIYDCLGT